MRLTGTTPPLFSGLPLPGWQSMKYSPMTDCGRVSQVALSVNFVKPGCVSLTWIFALLFGVSPNFVTLPALTPPTLTSPPWVRPNALSSSIQ